MLKSNLGRIALASMLLCACSDDGPATTDAASDADVVECDEDRRPIVFAHGFLSAGDHFASQAMRFATNGYCRDRIFAFDWNTLDNGDHVGELDAFIDAVLAETGADTVDLAGHSAGGRLGYDYLDDATRAAKVAHYAHVGSLLAEGPAGPDGEVPTLNLWSEGDAIISDKGDIPGATNVMIPGLDHIAILTSAESFDALFRHFNDDEAPETTEIAAQEPIFVSGKALSLGENTPAAGSRVAVYEVSEETGERLAEEPAAVFDVADDGRWGELEADPNAYYEFRLQGASTGDRPIHYYREPFVRSSQLVYHRALPDPSSLAGILLSRLPFDDDHAIIAVFIVDTALLAGRDSLTVGGAEVATEPFASADQMTVALFFYDANGNQQSDYTPIAIFGSIPFLVGIDAYFAADASEPIEVVYNGRTLHAPAWPSDSQGVSLVVFD